MKKLILLIIVSLNISDMKAQQTQTIDTGKYQGDWYVIGFKPSFLDKNWINTKEQYTWNVEKGYFDVVATYNKKPGGKQKQAGEKVIPVKGSRNSKWIARIGFLIRADYYVYKIADDYSYVVIGHPKQKYLYIMARKPKMNETIYQELVDFSVTLGYNRKDIVKHLQED